jgi:hypothetical protein
MRSCKTPCAHDERLSTGHQRTLAARAQAARKLSAANTNFCCKLTCNRATRSPCSRARLRDISGNQNVLIGAQGNNRQQQQIASENAAEFTCDFQNLLLRFTMSLRAARRCCSNSIPLCNIRSTAVNLRSVQTFVYTYFAQRDPN